MTSEIENKHNNFPSPSITDLLKLSGVSQKHFFKTLLPDLVVGFEDIKDPSTKYSAVIEALEAMQPKDVHELMLCIQILALHRQGMNYMFKLTHSNMDICGEKYLNATTKLLRLHGEKLEALMKYRRKCNQVVRVEHVHVHQGAQAVIGNVQAGGS